MTKLLYLQDIDMSLLKASATITAIFPSLKAIELDQTPFYPQGCGQPSDKGSISLPSGQVLAVTSVKKDPTGTILHYLLDSFDETVLKVGAQVECEVDVALRDLNTRAHSAGHILDHAVEDLKLPFRAGGGCHFLPGPYVEYTILDEAITIDQVYLTALKETLKEAANKLVAEDLPVQVHTESIDDDSERRLGPLPAACKESGMIRIVRFCRDGLIPIPCSGTHVTKSSEIKPISIKKISQYKEKRTIRVTYLLS